jgi:hypothetical protein
VLAMLRLANSSQPQCEAVPTCCVALAGRRSQNTILPAGRPSSGPRLPPDGPGPGCAGLVQQSSDATFPACLLHGLAPPHLLAMQKPRRAFCCYAAASNFQETYDGSMDRSPAAESIELVSA